MISRREFIQVAAATAALAPGGWPRAFAQQRLTQADLLAFEAIGNVTLVHLTDIHAQLMPVLFREPSINLGVGEARGQRAACHRARPPRSLQNPGRQRAGLCADLGGLLPRWPKATAGSAASTASPPC